MIQHMVCFKFKADTPPEAIQAHMRHFASLPGEIPQIVSYSSGLAVANGEQPPKYDSLHYLVFGTLEDLSIYDKHPAHQAFIQAQRAIWEGVLVVDAEIYESPA